jgi:hypothetical protein
MEMLSSAPALLAELQVQRHRTLRRLDRAVLSALCVRTEDARAALMDGMPKGAKDPRRAIGLAAAELMDAWSDRRG